MELGPVLVGIDGPKLTDGARDHLRHPLVGGVVLFTRNFESRDQLEHLIAAIQSVREPTLLLAVDQEGGRVQRFRDGFTRLPPLGRLGQLSRSQPERAAEYAYWHGRIMAAEMLDTGIDLSFAPVLDLDRGSEVIGDRAFGTEPQAVIELARAYVAGMHDAGMKTTGKHFPGHGSVRADTHIADVCDARSLDEIEATDLLPFATLVDSLDAIMTAHVSYPCLDERPAGYSAVWLKDFLRRRVGYKGVIFSDDLGMHAAKSLGNLAERTRAALEAGCDAVLVCRPEDVSALLDQWNHASVPTESGPLLDLLRGTPAIPRGSLRDGSTDAGATWARWRERLERLG